MDPKKIREAFRAHVRARVPADCSVTFKEHGGSPAITVPSDGVYLQQALGALTDEWGTKAAIVGSGGSIPVAGDFQRHLGLQSLLIGFAHDDDRIHSPEREVQPLELPPRHPLLGADPRGVCRGREELDASRPRTSAS